MANWNEPNRTTDQGFGTTSGRDGALAGGVTVDAGLRRYMLSIYNYMTSGVLLTGVVALIFASTPALVGVIYQAAATSRGVVLQPTLLGWIVSLSPLAIVFAMSFGANRFSATTLQMLFWGFAVLFGMSLSTIFIVYTGASIAATFFATAGAFAGLSLFGYTTKRNLSAMGTFFVMGVFGLIIASLLNFWLQSPSLYWAISFIGIVIFAGLTAWDTQRLKQQYYQVAGTEWMGKAIILGALSLYLDFINMFLFLLRFMGSSRN